MNYHGYPLESELLPKKTSIAPQLNQSMVLLSHCLKFITPCQTSAFPMPHHFTSEIKCRYLCLKQHPAMPRQHHSPDRLQAAKFVLTAGTHTVHLCNVHTKDLTGCSMLETRHVLEKIGKEFIVWLKPACGLESAIADEPAKAKRKTKGQCFNQPARHPSPNKPTNPIPECLWYSPVEAAGVSGSGGGQRTTVTRWTSHSSAYNIVLQM